MSSMTKKKIIDNLSEKCGLTKVETNNLIDSFSDLAKKELKKNGEFIVPNIGKLVKVKRKARMGRNPATGKEIKIPAKTTVTFRVGKAVKDAVG